MKTDSEVVVILTDLVHLYLRSKKRHGKKTRKLRISITFRQKNKMAHTFSILERRNKTMTQLLEVPKAILSLDVKQMESHIKLQTRR